MYPQNAVDQVCQTYGPRAKPGQLGFQSGPLNDFGK